MTNKTNSGGKAKDDLISWELFQRKYLSREDAFKAVISVENTRTIGVKWRLSGGQLSSSNLDGVIF